MTHTAILEAVKSGKVNTKELAEVTGLSLRRVQELVKFAWEDKAGIQRYCTVANQSISEGLGGGRPHEVTHYYPCPVFEPAETFHDA